jgi:gliding motility-associated-like protein
MFRFKWLPLALLLCSNLTFTQQVSIVESFDAQQLVEDNLVQGCVEISNISSPVNGNINGFASYGFFEKAGSNFPFDNGIVLSTGKVTSGGNFQNLNILNEGLTNWGTDTDLESATGISNLLNATAIQFDFISVSNQIQFNYILASEEYFANFPCLYSDGFAFLIRETGTNNPWQNIALVPGTNIPVNTSTIHEEIVGFCGEENSEFFDGYNIGDTNFNGRTEVLTATAVVVPNVQYTIKLVIADQSDQNYDSAVFIEGKSFNATVDLGEDISTCASSVYLEADLQNSSGAYSWYFNNTLIPGADQPIISVSQSGTYRVVVEIPVSGTICPIEDSINVSLSATQPANQIAAMESCDDASNDGTAFFDLSQHNSEVLKAVPSGNYAISYHYTNNDAVSNSNAITGQIQNSSNPQTIFVRIEDTDNGCLAYSDFDIVVNPQPIANAPSEIELCDDDADGVRAIDLSLLNSEIINGQTNMKVTYHWTPDNANTGNNPIPMPYVNSSPSEEIFIRLENKVTGCYDTTSAIIRVTPVPDVNLEPIFIDACDADFDGFASFDLSAITNEVLNGITGVTVSFYESYEEAFTDTNPITDPTNYINILINEQILYVRVTDDDSGCFAVREIEIHTNLLLSETILDEFSQCDIGNDGIEAFDLSAVALSIINNLNDVTVNFYLTEKDRDDGINALDVAVPFIPTSNPQTLWIDIQSSDCMVQETIDLVLTPITEFPSIGVVDYCDDNQDGFTKIGLREFDDLILGDAQGFSVNYYETLEDAESGSNSLGNFYNNISNPQTIYYDVRENINGCTSVNSFEIAIIPSPTANNLSDQYFCDADQDGVIVVNLEDYIPLITPSTTDVAIHFYLFRNSAENDINPIINPTNFSTSGRKFFARVESLINGCYNIAEFNIKVNTVPVAAPIEDYIFCHDLNNGIGSFLFKTKDQEIINGQAGKVVSYYTKLFDAENRINSIDKNSPYQNVTNPQTIYVRIENDDDASCYVTSSFNIEVGATPDFNEPANIFVCDDISNDGISVFDFEEKIAEIADGINDNLEITFHGTLYGAENGNAPLPLTYVNTSNPQQIYVRITNGTACHSITNFLLNVIQLPEIEQQEANFTKCDTNYDGIVSWDLTLAEFEVLDVRQDNIAVSYHETIEDAENDTNVIFNPKNFHNSATPQTVYIRINNTVSNCYVTVPINLNVNIPPAINTFTEVEICDNPEKYFHLGDVNSLITNSANDIIYSYHSTQADAEAGINDLNWDYTYQTTQDTIYARVINKVTGCVATYAFQLTVNPNPIVHQAPPLYACDDSSNNSLELVDLNEQRDWILGSQDLNDFAVSYFDNEVDAENGTNPISSYYEASHNQSIYTRIDNNLTGCYSIGSFKVMIRPYPTINEPLVSCDNDYDGMTIVDLTEKEALIASSTTGAVTFTYFETLEALEDDSAPISHPEAYHNYANPQTVYIRVNNLDSNCSATVPMQLTINLPPTLVPVDEIEICNNGTQTILLSEISNVLVDDSEGLLFSYYRSYEDAEQDINTLDTNYAYSTHSDVVFARVKNLDTQCFFIKAITIIINENPVVSEPESFEVCDDSSNNGMADVYLYEHDASVLGDLSSNTHHVTYFSLLSDAENATNALTEPTQVNHGDVIFARVENIQTGCYSVVDFEVVIHPHPDELSPIVLCDTDYDETLVLDLTIYESQIAASTTGIISISYFETVENLQDNTGAIFNPASYTNYSNPQTVYVKVNNASADCYSVLPLNIEINSPPLISDVTRVDFCDNESDHILLSDITEQILIDQGTDVLVNYYLSQSDADNEINSLPINYNYQSNDFNLFVDIKFASTHCPTRTMVRVVINEVPVAHQPPTVEHCDEDNDRESTFDLGEFTSEVIGNQNAEDLLVTYYLSEEDALYGLNMIDEIYQAKDGDTIYVRIENVTTLCFDTTAFLIRIYPPRPLVEIADQVICRENLPLLVDAYTGNSNDLYLWSTGATTASIVIEEIGDYWLTVTTPFGCQSTAEFSVIESEQATIVFTEILDFSANNSITVNVEGIGNYLYSLDDGDPQESNFFNNVSLGYHTITVLDLNGCAKTTKEVLVINAPKFFTPNNDGDFDTWHIVGVETMPGTVVHVFDRTGKHIISLTHDSEGWDGNYNGLKLPATDYWFIAEVRKDKIRFEVKGHFALRR